tara:strand:+ start:418 stop:630 length:213 start_codon:yes stop_codon:yes gene_type:complete
MKKVVETAEKVANKSASKQTADAQGPKEAPVAKEMVINIELAQAVLNYLGSKPYAEVAELVKGIQGSKLQ